MRDPLPHQMAVGAGMIKPKYPASPRTWVTNFDQRPQAPAAAPIPRVSAGVQRDFSATYPGAERFRRIERLGSLLASAGLGYSYATKEDVQQEDEAPGLPSPDDLTKKKPLALGRGARPHGGPGQNSIVGELESGPPVRFQGGPGRNSILGEIGSGSERIMGELPPAPPKSGMGAVMTALGKAQQNADTARVKFTGSRYGSVEDDRVDLKPERSDFVGPTVPAGGPRTGGLGGFGQSRFRADIANLNLDRPATKSRANKRSKKKK